MQPHRIDDVVEKLRALSPERVTEVEDFIDFLKQRDEDRQLTRAAMRATEPVLEKIWDNADDAGYDKLYFGDIVLVGFPFTNQTGEKQRPADTRLQRRLQQIEKLDPTEKRQVLQFIDAFIERGQLRRRAG